MEIETQTKPTTDTAQTKRANMHLVTVNAGAALKANIVDAAKAENRYVSQQAVVLLNEAFAIRGLSPERRAAVDALLAEQHAEDTQDV